LIATAREKAGLSAKAADRLQLSVASYYDLEHDDDEAFMTISLTTLIELGRTLGVPVRQLVDDQNPTAAARPVTYDELASRVRAQIEAEGIVPDAWGQKVGWEVSALLADPGRIADLNLDGLADICSAVGVDWRAVLTA
jgi:transcriptional regulator with XRE-family HTH domain